MSNLHFWVLLRTLADLHFQPSGDHVARQWSCRTALQLSLWVYNLDIKPGLFFYDVEYIADINLAHTSFSVCILFVALSPYVSMGTVACWGQLLAIDNGWNRMCSDHPCEKHTSIFVFCWPMRVGIQLGLCPLCTGMRFLKWGWHPLLTLIGCHDNV